jgi:drug/metabolite transporter (DMT)-like permease
MNTNRVSRAEISPRAWVVFITMCLIFGTTFLAIKIGSNAGIPPFLAAGTRFLLAGAVLIAVRGGVASSARRPSWSYLWRVAVLGTLIIGITFAATYTAADFIGSGHIAQIQAVAPVLVAMMSVILRTRLTLRHGVGLGIGLGGTLLLVGSLGGLHALAIWGALAAFAAEISYSLGSIWYRKMFPAGTDSVQTNGYSMFFGGLFVLSLAIARGQTSFPADPAAFGSLAYLVVFGSIGAHSMYLWLVANVSPVFASTWLFVSPIIATLLGAVVLGEVITVWNVLGAAAVLTGVYLIQRAERRRVAAAGDGPERRA